MKILSVSYLAADLIIYNGICLFFFLQGKIVHQSLNIMNSFSQKVKIQHIRSLSEDVRFYYKRLRGNREDLEPGKKSKVG